MGKESFCPSSLSCPIVSHQDACISIHSGFPLPATSGLARVPVLEFLTAIPSFWRECPCGHLASLKQRLDNHKEWCHEYCDATRSLGRDAAPTRGNQSSVRQYTRE